MPEPQPVIITPIRMKHFCSPPDAIDYAFDVLTRSLGDELHYVRAPHSTVIKNKIHDINKASKRLLQAHRALIAFAEAVTDVLTETPLATVSRARLQQLNTQRLRALALAGPHTQSAPTRHPATRPPCA